MPKVLEKVERRLGEKLYIKGERCLSGKCAVARKAYPPGVHGKKRSRGKSEFGEQLSEKQKVRYLYGLSEQEIKKYFAKALAIPGTTSNHMLNFLERRLDNMVFRAGFTISRSIARHLISHGHILVNGTSITAPSYLVKRGDSIEIKESRIGMPVFAELAARLQKYQGPAWIEMDKESKKAKVIGLPAEDVSGGAGPDLKRVIEYYSR